MFSHLYTDHMMYEYDKHHFLFEGAIQELRYYAYMLPGTQKHWTLSLKGKTEHICVKGIHASCCSPICSGCSWPPPSLAGMLPNMDASVQGERTVHRHVVFHKGLEERRIGESKHLMISVCFLGGWSEMSLVPTLFCSLFHLCFFWFSHRIWVWPESYSRSTRHIHSDWRGSHHELSVWNKLRQLQHFLV